HGSGRNPERFKQERSQQKHHHDDREETDTVLHPPWWAVGLVVGLLTQAGCLGLVKTGNGRLDCPHGRNRHGAPLVLQPEDIKAPHHAGYHQQNKENQGKIPAHTGKTSTSLFIFNLQDSKKCFLRYLDVANLLHTFLPSLLLFKQFLLSA